jgi:hypothetical protein
MDTPQLSRIESYARVSAASRPDETRAAHGSREFTALVIGEDAAGRRRPSHPEQEPDTASAEESVIEAQPSGAAEDILPEDAHDPQELRALLSHPHD